MAIIFIWVFLVPPGSVSSPLLKVGIDEVLDVIVSLENREENSYNSYVTLTYPAGISYTKFTMIKVRPVFLFSFLFSFD